MAGWTTPYHLLREEFTQRRDEGCQVPAELAERFAALDAERDAWRTDRIDPLYDAVMALPEDAALAACEPNELAAIRALRPGGPRDLHWQPSEAEALDRFHGAWTGRCVGCALGKPVEGMGMGVREGRLVGRADIKRYLSERGDWPLRDYISARELPGDGPRVWATGSVRERIDCMEPDDDIHYSLVGLGVLEATGPDFTWQDVAAFWTSHIPFAMICTAETQAILNLWNRSCHGWPRGKGAATSEWTRRWRNPYREWIGAQIRSDGWAWACAGKPELAAEFAWRDASWTHERNGIYGAMFCAAMQAAAFVESDPCRLIAIGLSEIPAQCRLARQVRAALGWVDACPDFEACMERLEAALPTMSAVHTINNALVCVLALCYGAMDPTRSVTTAVMCGLDTDCNGATVGSLVGAVSGRARFGDGLAARLNDTIKPGIVGFAEVRMAELARRTLVQWRRVEAWRGANVAV
ncbi:MAG: ADP-ribosylglycohydrolase family protein [Planctomycetes bacterium]|nr:ADP-ribosylglycohydrolase family protein [Planctomycetota bacterium]